MASQQNPTWGQFYDACFHKIICENPDIENTHYLEDRIRDYARERRDDPSSEDSSGLTDKAIDRMVAELTDPPGLKERLKAIIQSTAADIRKNPEKYSLD